MDNSQEITKAIHFCGIGGIGMSAIADLMMSCGHKVQGSNIVANDNTERLSKRGAKVFVGHSPDHLDSADQVIYSTAILSDNPEIICAKKRNIKILHRAEALAMIMKNYRNIVISGSHGKTTVTSLIGSMLDYARLDPTIIVGGIMNGYKTNYRNGKLGGWLVAESDESDGSFVKLPRKVSVITNIDREHMERYNNDFNVLIDHFVEFANDTEEDGAVIIGIDNQNCCDLIPRIKHKNIVTYSLNKKADIVATNLVFGSDGYVFDIHNNKCENNDIVSCSTVLYGLHNIQNILASFAVMQELKIDGDIVKNAIANFSGVKRRFSILGTVNGATIVDDYAHHPVEIASTISSARQFMKSGNHSGKLICVFQPHRYSRTQLLMNEFANSFAEIDFLIVTQIYAASEEPIDGVSGQVLSDRILASKLGNRTVEFVDSMDSVLDHLSSLISNNDVVLFLGAGDISTYAHRFCHCE